MSATRAPAWRKAGFALRATPAVFASARRVRGLDRRLPFDELLAALRRPGRPLPDALTRRPLWLAGTVERWLPLLPPRRYGPCLRRALIVLDLWSRAGLEPTLHLGFRLDAPTRDGHAWLTAETSGGEILRVSGPNGHEPLFEL